jgi:hypothetical protein
VCVVIKFGSESRTSDTSIGSRYRVLSHENRALSNGRRTVKIHLLGSVSSNSRFKTFMPLYNVYGVLVQCLHNPGLDSVTFSLQISPRSLPPKLSLTYSLNTIARSSLRALSQPLQNSRISQEILLGKSPVTKGSHSPVRRFVSESRACNERSEFLVSFTKCAGDQSRIIVWDRMEVEVR